MPLKPLGARGLQDHTGSVVNGDSCRHVAEDRHSRSFDKVSLHGHCQNGSEKWDRSVDCSHHFVIGHPPTAVDDLVADGLKYIEGTCGARRKSAEIHKALDAGT